MALVAERWLGPWLEAWHLTTALALSTNSIELITAVQPGILNPQVVAKFGATMHVISKRRCAINVVNGWQRPELEVYGNGAWLDDPHARYKRMDEFIRVIRGLWTDSEFALDGEFYRVNCKGLPVALPAPPAPRIYSTSRSDAGQNTIANLCDVWFIDAPGQHRLHEKNFTSIAALSKCMDRRCQAIGRSVEYCLNATVLCLDDLNEALSRADELEVKAKGDRKMLIPGGVLGLGGGLVGTPNLVIERMQRYQEIGISSFMLRFIPEPAGRMKFLRDVAPRLH